MEWCRKSMPTASREQQEIKARLYKQSAEAGFASGQYLLGRCYFLGHGVAQDHTQAVTWLRKAAEQGHADAQCNLGACYANGQGVPEDHAQALAWYRKAAEQGHEKAQSALTDHSALADLPVPLSVSESPEADSKRSPAVLAATVHSEPRFGCDVFFCFRFGETTRSFTRCTEPS